MAGLKLAVSTARSLARTPEAMAVLAIATGALKGTLAFDKDVSPSTLTALIAARELAKHPGSKVIHNLITSRAVPEIISECGGTPVRSRVGHSYIKAVMAETDAVFGG